MGFEQALVNTLKLEGGTLQDSDGLTHRGIRQDIYNSWSKQQGITPKDVRSLTAGEVKKFYKTEFWDRNKLDSLGNDRLASIVFDHAVQSGGSTAIKSLQKIVGSKPDGIMGKNTREAINNYNSQHSDGFLEHQILNERANNYTMTAQSNPLKAGNLQGWYNRISNLKEMYNLNQPPQSGASTTQGE